MSFTLFVTIVISSGPMSAYASCLPSALEGVLSSLRAFLTAYITLKIWPQHVLVSPSEKNMLNDSI